MKMNSLVDADIIDALYEASQAGVSIDLVVRGICCLRPQIPGFSDNIRVKSIVRPFPRTQPHLLFRQWPAIAQSRATVYIGSADMMHRQPRPPSRGAECR